MSKQQILMMSLVGSIIYLCFSGIILQYVNDLEENVCVCSNHWYREFIKYFTSLMVVIIIPYIFAQKKYNDHHKPSTNTQNSSRRGSRPLQNDSSYVYR